MLEDKERIQASDLGRVLAMVNAYQQTCLIAAASNLGLFHELSTGARSIEELAGDLHANRDALGRLIRALCGLGLATQENGGRASLTGAGRLLAANGFASGLRAWTELVSGEYLECWSRLADGVRTGRSVFEPAFGCSPWEHRESHPRLNEAFNRVTSGEQARTISALLRAYDFSGRKCVADVGGGHGHLLGGILSKHRQLRGIVFDLPHVVAGAQAALAESGVADRCEIVGGSFLDLAPSGADVHVLKHVLHNWDDNECKRILRNVRSAIAEGGRVLILEDVMPDDVGAALPVIMLDIHMLLVHGGRERTESEYGKLLRAAGFEPLRLLRTRPGAPSILEAAPV